MLKMPLHTSDILVSVGNSRLLETCHHTAEGGSKVPDRICLFQLHLYTSEYMYIIISTHAWLVIPRQKLDSVCVCVRAYVGG